MKINEKINVRVDIDTFTHDNFPRTADELVSIINEYKDKYPDSQLLFNSYIEEDYGYNYCKFEIYTNRLETDEEYTERLENLKVEELKNKNRKLKEYLKLKREVESYSDMDLDLIKASELVLQELSNMTDEELVLALEACEDNSIGYAACSEGNKS